MTLVLLNDHFKIIENSTLRVSFSIILKDHLIALVAMVYPVNKHHATGTAPVDQADIIYVNISATAFICPLSVVKRSCRSLLCLQ